MSPELELSARVLAFAGVEVVRGRAPKLVTAAETLDFTTLTPAPGGLFDYKVFGPGTVIDAPAVGDDEVVKPRKTQFARITLGLPMPHPLLLERAPARIAELAGWTRADVDRWRTGRPEPEPPAHDLHDLIEALASRGHADLVIRELPVLPPDLRPLRRLDDDRWAVSAINDHYRRVIHRNQRLARVVETNAPHAIIASEREQLHAAMVQLMDGPLRELCGGGAGIEPALRALDRHPAGAEPTGALYRSEAALFALGFVSRALPP